MVAGRDDHSVRRGDEIIDENEAFGIPNRPFEGTIKVVKTSKTGNTPVAGAEFSIYDEAGYKIKSITIDDRLVVKSPDRKIAAMVGLRRGLLVGAEFGTELALKYISYS